jgi:hypothetical protein
MVHKIVPIVGLRVKSGIDSKSAGLPGSATILRAGGGQPELPQPRAPGRRSRALPAGRGGAEAGSLHRRRSTARQSASARGCPRGAGAGTRIAESGVGRERRSAAPPMELEDAAYAFTLRPPPSPTSGRGQGVGTSGATTFRRALPRPAWARRWPGESHSCNRSPGGIPRAGKCA